MFQLPAIVRQKQVARQQIAARFDLGSLNNILKRKPNSPYFEHMRLDTGRQKRRLPRHAGQPPVSKDKPQPSKIARINQQETLPVTNFYMRNSDRAISIRMEATAVFLA
jgi:hypothetical protein